jgi:hypothetical protein
VGIVPKGNYNGIFGWTRDDNAQQTVAFDQGGGDVLAGSAKSIAVSTAVQDGDGTSFGTGLFAHGFSVGDVVILSFTNSPASNYDGTYRVTKVGPIRFSVAVTFITGSPSLAGGLARSSSTAHFFVLGTSHLGGSKFVDRFFSLEEGGEFRSIQFQVSQNGLNEDLDIHSLFVEFGVGADSTEN